MHRLHHSNPNLQILRGYLEELDDDAQPYSDNHEVFRLYDILQSHKHSKITKPTHHSALYNKIKGAVTQLSLQLIYHMPIKQIPLYVNHRKNITKTIVKWRLDLGH